METHSGDLELLFEEDDLITVYMGTPRHLPEQIPLLAANEKKLYELLLRDEVIKFSAVSMGNPHAVIQVDDVDKAPVESIGKLMECHPIFPERANVGFMQIITPQSIRLRVYERGAAETLACGSGACAAVVVGIEREQLDENVVVSLPGGDLKISWPGRGKPVKMTGPADFVFEGQIRL